MGNIDVFEFLVRSSVFFCRGVWSVEFRVLWVSFFLLCWYFVVIFGSVCGCGGNVVVRIGLLIYLGNN